jgi:uracil-DNA glycosylase
MRSLIIKAKKCTLCQSSLPNLPKPIFQLHPEAKILIIGQAPGIKAHDANKPFADASGERLRKWLGLTNDEFYHPQIAIMPMGFCYPGKLDEGDAPPSKLCAQTWHHLFLKKMPNITLTILLGKYAIAKYLPIGKKESISKILQDWRKYLPLLPLPHPSPRNNIWLDKNEWFEKNIIPQVRTMVAKHLKD